MWRTVIVNNGEKVSIDKGWLCVETQGQESRVPIEDIYALIIDNHLAMISIATIVELTKAGTHICFCDGKHIPIAEALPLIHHYKPLAVMKQQFALTKEQKDLFWREIIVAKIKNQARCLQLRQVIGVRCETVLEMAGKVREGDSTNREAVAAKMYFPFLFGQGFRRSDEDVTNGALDYCYAVLRTSVAKTLVAYGYCCVLGIHHENESNPFNLADDLMEPLRPLADMLVDSMCDELFETLSRDNRRKLASVVNLPVKIKGKKMRLRYAIDAYISSFTTAIKNNDVGRLEIPEIVELDDLFKDERDGE